MKGHGKNVSGRLAGAAIRCQPDSRLVGLAREGHDRAFDEIVRRYRAPLVAFAAGFVPHHRAEDVVQEALTKAHGAITHGDAEINLRPWLFTIVRNGALNAVRDEPVHEHLEESFDGVPQPPEVAAEREEMRSLTDRLKGLPDPQRKALVKRELEGRSHEHIASSMGVTTGAVRGLIFRARTALRDGAGMLIPTPVLRALLSEGSVAPEAAGATAAAGLAAGGGGGIAVKAGATLGVAVLAVGSGLAIQHRGEKPDHRAEASAGQARSDARHVGGSGSGARVPGADPLAKTMTSNEGLGSSSSGPGGHQGTSGSSGPGPGSGEGSSGDGSGGDGQEDGDDSGSGSSGADSSGSGSSPTGSDSSGSGSSGSGETDSSGSGSSGFGESDSSGSGSSGSASTDSSGSGSSGSDEEDDEA
jgi:RNA polymerase sigma factor (sigma-70 family)